MTNHNLEVIKPVIVKETTEEVKMKEEKVIKEGEVNKLTIKDLEIMFCWEGDDHGFIFKNKAGDREYALTYESGMHYTKAFITMLKENGKAIIQFIMDVCAMKFAAARAVYDAVVNGMNKLMSKEDGEQATVVEVK